MDLFIALVMSLATVISNGVKQAPHLLVALASTSPSGIAQVADDLDPGPTPTPEIATLPAPLPAPSDSMEIVEPAPSCSVPVEPAAPPADVVIQGTISIQGIDVPFQLTGILPGLGIRVGQYEFTVNTPTGT